MFKIKIWLIILSISLITLDKFSFISKIRDSSAIFIGKQLSLFKYRVTNYPRFVMLQRGTQQELEKENRQLKKQVEEYAITLKQQSNQQIDAKALQDLKAQTNIYGNFDLVVVRAVIDVNYLVNNKLLIDQGSNKGINVGQAVVNKDGVIGQIGIVNLQNAQATLITNPDYKIYLQNSVTKSKMLAQGIGNNNLLVKYISKDEKISVGNVLVTTGLDDVYPANLPVAKVIKVFNENNGFNSALCVPVADFNKLQFVLVLKHAN